VGIALVKAPITCPSTERAELMYIAYFDLTPVVYVFFCRYEPAKSTRFNFPTLTFDYPLISCICSTFIINMECDLDETLFIYVEPTCLLLLPYLNFLFMSYTVVT
jgi:hypothetical protein